MGSAGINSLNVGGNQWRVDNALDSVDPRVGLAESTRVPRITLPLGFQAGEGGNEVEYVNLFLHSSLFSRMSEHTNLNIVEDSAKVSEEDMRRFVGVMFAMTVTPMSNIKDYWKVEDDGLLLASRFFESTSRAVRNLLLHAFYG